jgi:hypothetical protein
MRIRYVKLKRLSTSTTLVHQLFMPVLVDPWNLKKTYCKLFDMLIKDGSWNGWDLLSESDDGKRWTVGVSDSGGLLFEKAGMQ